MFLQTDVSHVTHQAPKGIVLKLPFTCRRFRARLCKSWRHSFPAVALSLSLLIAPWSIAVADGTASGQAMLPKSTVSTVLRLSATEKMAHPVAIGALGPWHRAQVWLTQSVEVDDAPYRGRIVVESGSWPAAVYALPAADETESAYLMKVRAVMFRNVDQDAAKELIVLYSATRIGPQQPTEYASNVYKWNGQSFIRLSEVEAKLSGAKNSADVLRRLARTRSGSKQ